MSKGEGFAIIYSISSLGSFEVVRTFRRDIITLKTEVNQKNIKGDYSFFN